jgi:hypothetical protein
MASVVLNHKEYKKFSLEILSRARAHLTIDFMRSQLENLSQKVLDAILRVSCDQQAIPNRDALDRLIRYETAADRALSRALDRPDTLQRRRKGEAVQPRLNATID